MLGLLAIGGIPTTIGVSEGITRRDEPKKHEREAQRLRKFNLVCFCDEEDALAATIHNRRLVLRDGKVWTAGPGHDFEGFYIEYPDPDRPKPLPLGMVSTIAVDPPLLNWIYVDRETRELRYGNRSESKAHIVGSWGWDAGEEGGAGGVTLNGKERAIAVQTTDGWELRWEDKHGLYGSAGTKARTFRVSLDRVMVDGRQVPASEPMSHPGAVITTDQKQKPVKLQPGMEKRTTEKLTLTKDKLESSYQEDNPSGRTTVRLESGDQPITKGQPRLEFTTKSTQKRLE